MSRLFGATLLPLPSLMTIWGGGLEGVVDPSDFTQGLNGKCIFFLFAVGRNSVVMDIVNVNFLSATTTYRMLEDISENYLH